MHISRHFVFIKQFDVLAVSQAFLGGSLLHPSFDLRTRLLQFYLKIQKIGSNNEIPRCIKSKKKTFSPPSSGHTIHYFQIQRASYFLCLCQSMCIIEDYEHLSNLGVYFLQNMKQIRFRVNGFRDKDIRQL